MFLVIYGIVSAPLTFAYGMHFPPFWKTYARKPRSKVEILWKFNKFTESGASAVPKNAFKDSVELKMRFHQLRYFGREICTR